jgi:hypothetical protein
VRWFKLFEVCSVAAWTVSLFAGSPALAATSTVYSFDLAPANTAVSPNGGTMCGITMAGDWISVTGSATFDPAAQTIRAKGSFTHHNSSEAVVC